MMQQRHQASPFDLDPKGLVCPHPYYDQLRSSEPVSYVESIGAWVITRYDDIREVLANVDRYTNRHATGPRYADLMRTAMTEVLDREDVPDTALTAVRYGRWQVLLNADPPLHDRQRKLVNRAFTPRQVAKAEPQVQEIADRLIDSFADRGAVELVSEFSWLLPLEVIANRLGVPVEDMPSFKRWSDDMAALVGNHSFSADELTAKLASQGEFYEYFTERLAEAKKNPKDDVLGKIATAELDDDTLSDEEQLGMVSQFLVAGHETTTNLISMSALRLARDRDLADRLRHDPQAIPAFVEEVLRLDSPTQGMFRRAKEDVTIGGVKIPEGDYVFLSYASANVDAEAFECPRDLDLERESTSSHLAFGHGTHYCLGAPLARQEGRIALTGLLARMDDIRVADESEPRYNPSYFLRGLSRLDLEFAPRTPR